MTEKILLSKSTEVDELTDEEYSVAKKAVNELRESKKARVELQQMSDEDAASAKSSGRVYGDPFIVINE